MLSAARAQSAVHSAFDVPPDVLPALDCLRVAVTLFDASERLTYCSRHFNYVLRAQPDRESLIGRTYEELIRMELACGETSPGGTQDAEAYIAYRRAQLRAGEYAPRDVELADGRIVEVKARQAPEGGWIVLWSDATQARHLLHRLETAVDLSADAFAFWDSGDRLILCSAQFAELHGYHSPDDMMGEHFRDIVVTAVRRDRFRLEGDVENWIEGEVARIGVPAR